MFAVIGGSRLTNEAAYSWAKLAKGVIGTDSVDAQLGDGLPAAVLAGLPRATIEDACTPDGTVLVLDADLKDELPVLFLRVRDAVTRRRSTVVEVSARQTSLWDLAAHSVRHVPGAIDETIASLIAGEGDHGPVRDALAKGPLTVILGRSSVAESADSLVAAARALHEAFPEARFLSGLRRGNVHGALDMGLAPGMLPGQVSLDDGRAWFTDRWGQVPQAVGNDTAGILAAAAAGRVDTLILLGADPLGDFPDQELARRGLAGARTVIAVETFANDSTAMADVVLPAAGFTEVDGTTTNLEGRVTVLQQKITPPGTARPDWMIAAELAFRLGADLGFSSVEEIWAEIQRVSTAHAGMTLAALAQEVDGLLAGRGADAGARPARAGLPESDYEAPPIDNYSLRLVTRRRLYDNGTMVSHAPSLAGLAGTSSLSVNPDDLERIGVTDGARVKVTSPKGSLTTPVRFDAAVPVGTAVLDWNQGDPSPRTLIDATAAVTEVRVETTR